MRRRSVIALTLATGLATPCAFAQTSVPFNQNIDMQQFRPAAGPHNLLTVMGSRVEGRGNVSLGAWVHYANRPFTIFNATCPNAENDVGCTLGGVRSRPIESLVTLDLLATITLARRVQIGLALPLVYETGQAVNPANAYPLGPEQTQQGFALGDPRLDVKIRIAGQGLRGAGFAVNLFGNIPTGRFTGGDNHFIADGTVTLGGRAIVDVRAGRFFAAANVGALWRPETLALLSTRFGSALTWGAGAGVQATPRLGFLAELFGSTNFTTAQQSNGTEVNAAARYTLGDVTITAGGGAGIIRAAGTPVARAFAAVSWAPVRVDGDGDRVDDSVDQCPNEPEDHDGYDDLDGCPEEDNDGDGILDAIDRCPDVAEDHDNFQDSDGCPDVDNDNDGVADGYDSCPREPEDRDGDHDEDGCPDNDRDRDGVHDETDRCPEPDNDGDGVPDVSDQCSDQPETRNGIDDTDGCPDGPGDADHDGIADDRDLCPHHAETINGDHDEDGCPAPSGAIAMISGTQIRIHDNVSFQLNSDRIVGGASFRVLDSVVALLNFHPEIRGVEIQGHTDDRGDPVANRALSQRRALAVKAYLVAHGISADRLTTMGHGHDRPTDRGDTSAARARNRRVEFHIIPAAEVAASPLR